MINHQLPRPSRTPLAPKIEAKAAPTTTDGNTKGTTANVAKTLRPKKRYLASV